MTDNILEKLGIGKKKPTTAELKEMLLLKPGEKTPMGNVVTPESYRMSLAIPDERELRMRQYFDAALKECIEDIRYNTSIVGTECICKKMQDEKFRDTTVHPERHISEKDITKFPKNK